MKGTGYGLSPIQYMSGRRRVSKCAKTFGYDFIETGNRKEKIIVRKSYGFVKYNPDDGRNTSDRCFPVSSTAVPGSRPEVNARSVTVGSCCRVRPRGTRISFGISAGSRTHHHIGNR